MFRKAFLALFLVGMTPAVSSWADVMPANFKVAFIGDSGNGSGFRSVLNLIKQEGTNLVLHQGDFDYKKDPDGFNRTISDVLGDDFPYLGSIGNHDVKRWDGYQRHFQERLAKIDGMQCEGDLGVKSACEYKGFFFILSGAGTRGDGHEEYIREKMAQSQDKWKFCSWHKNMKAMQVGGKDDETGWGVYEACREAGAIIGTAHEHSYSRTHVLSSMEHQTLAAQHNPMVVDRGQTFVFVSGLGGKGARGQERGGDHWASIYTSDQGAKVGALFCEFAYQGVQDQAHCYFKNVDGEVVDNFMVQSAL